MLGDGETHGLWRPLDPILKRVSLILIWLKLMLSQKAICGSVGARRAGNPEEGGSS